MAIATLDAIINKVRKLTGAGDSQQLTDTQIIDYVNSFYLYDFPAQYRALKLKDKYIFNTQYGIDVYPFDSEHWTTVEMPCYCAKREIKLFNDPWSFYGVWYNWQQIQNLTQGDGTSGPYTGILNSHPIIRSVNNNPRVTTTLSSTQVFPGGVPPAFPQANIGRVQNLLITVNNAYGTTLNVTDDGAGNLIGDVDSLATNTINYQTGAISLTFNVAVVAGATLQVQYNPATPSIPLGIMFFQNQFTLRPVPDRGYTVELVGYRLPSQALLGTDNPNSPNLAGVPELQEWWETIAFGAAKKFLEDQSDMEGVAIIDKALRERYDLNETRTYAQMGKIRVNTIYADQLSGNYGNTGWGWGSGSS